MKNLVKNFLCPTTNMYYEIVRDLKNDKLLGFDWTELLINRTESYIVINKTQGFFVMCKH